jgi:homogentisate 1,2-dioxygenase
MIDRSSAGLLPAKPHTVHRAPDGRLLHEEMFTRAGFDGPFSYLYHLFPITPAKRVEAGRRGFTRPALAEDGLHPLKRRLYDANRAWDAAIGKGGQMIDRRTPILFNADLVVSLAAPTVTDDVYFANNDGDELHYVVSGSARLESSFGWLDVKGGDYVQVPRSVIHRWHPTPGDPPRILVMEGRRNMYVPPNFRNMVGQLTMNAPYIERDFVRPTAPIATPDLVPEGPRELYVKKADRFSRYELERCPMDVVGWEGFVYPFAFSIEKYQPKTGQIHLPPTVHTTFMGDTYVVCSFVPRVTDFHPDAIPCPYPHSSVDCDEVILYLRGNFTSRRGVGPGSISLHPSGIAHGPHPGAYEASIGSVKTDELAVMIDTFGPLQPTVEAVAIENAAYHDSWATPAT